MNATDKFSICIPTRNRASFLAATLETAQRQSPAPRIVVTDNASTDNTLEVVRQYREKGASVHLRQHPHNIGADRNFESAIAEASTEYCWLLGSDDLLKPGACGAVLEAMRHDPDIIVVDFDCVSRDGRRTFASPSLLSAPDQATFSCANTEERLKFLRANATHMSMFTFMSTAIVKRAAWLATTPPDWVRETGWTHVWRALSMIQQGARVLYLKRPLVTRRVDNDSFAEAQGYTNRRCIDIRLVSVLTDAIPSHPERESLEQFAERHFFSVVRSLLIKSGAREHDGEEAISTLREAYRVFESRPGYRSKMFLWERFPLFLVDGVRWGSQLVRRTMKVVRSSQ